MNVRASEQAIRKAREVLTREGWAESKLLEIVTSRNRKLSSQQRTKFFNGEPIARSTADRIGSFLGLTWEKGDLITVKPEKRKQDNSSDIDELVQEVRSLYRDKIQYDCGEMKLLNRQVPINDLYTDVYILEDTPKLRSLNISERMQGFDPIADNPNSFYLGKVRGERVPGLEMVTEGCKVMCLGAPGSGKTTYLYYVAIQCNKGELQANRVPIFIRLIEFTDTIKNQPELSLLNYINNLFHTEGVEQPQAIETIITQGRALILFDGLDEVPQNFRKLVLSRIREFCKYRKNSIIITCRTNTLDYSFSDLKFTQIIVADFEQPQIEIFANKWFVAGAKNDKQAGEARAKEFIEKLGLAEHKRIRDLAVTPILLNLTCLVFKNNLGEFPKNRSELYQRGINILLEEWDAERGIERDEVYGRLDLEGRKALLTHVAKVSFEENRYFFKQEEIEKYIADYLRTLPHAQIDSLQRDSRAVLKSIEVQHGLLMERAPEIYSFSHLTFQEYFTAKWFCDRDWKSLVKYVTEVRWGEIFLLAVQILQSPDELFQVMKQQIDLFLVQHEKKNEFQNFLAQLHQKALIVKPSNEIIVSWLSKSFKLPYQLSSVCAFYLAIDPNIVRSLELYYDLVGFRS
ncbi:MAG TPA: NACHT domain-containing protein, partial [Allocoleopsis sp.]